MDGKGYVMSSVKQRLLTGIAVAALCGSQAYAADYPSPPPPQQVIYQQVPVPVPVQDFGGWYLRGDIGMSNQKIKGIDYFRNATAPGFTWLDEGGVDSAPFFGLGIGYQYNDWLRFDLTGEYRGKANFHALARYNDGAFGSDDYRGTKREWLFLANAYLDLGTWWCITPFIGAGVGFANITIDHFYDNNVLTGGGGYADSGSVTNFAWAVHAGLAYKVNPNFTVELAYRYLNMGDGETGIAYNLDGSTSNQVFTIKDITSHDLKFGVRWNLQDSTPGVRPAVFTPPPAPVYAQPQQQVITMPQQVITAPPQVVTAPPPAPVYAQPQPLYQPQYTPAPAPQPQYAPPPPNWQYQQQPPLMRRG
ncbi:MAG: outer membrane beta-barrel protein [Pseudorhodoplanes sp.]|jgi:opacity protein-like surface antigen|nr:outer membrane beta-barrel protein [Pseudorhodoplanes sp.]